MRYIAQSTRGMTQLMMLNMDRFLTPLLIVAALTLAGWVFAMAQPW